MKTCCFTGHRDICAEDIVRLPEVLDTTLDRLIASGVGVFRAGGAVGFDTLCALKVLEKKKKDPKIRLELCLPCKDQTQGWPERDVNIYNYILSAADSVRYVGEKYVRGCMHVRNRMLVDGSDVCVTYCKESVGGTAYTCRYALKRGVELINLADVL